MRFCSKILPRCSAGERTFFFFLFFNLKLTPADRLTSPDPRSRNSHDFFAPPANSFHKLPSVICAKSECVSIHLVFRGPNDRPMVVCSGTTISFSPQYIISWDSRCFYYGISRFFFSPQFFKVRSPYFNNLIITTFQ